jgi:hypothetical protein
MRRNIDLPEILWDTLTTLADDMGYSSRQALIEEVITVFTNQYPDAKIRSMDASAKRLARLKDKQDFKELENTTRFKKASTDEIMELWDGDITGLTDGVKEQVKTADQVVKEYANELPEANDSDQNVRDVNVPHETLPELPEI